MVYVDRLFPTIPYYRWRHSEACHLWADTVGELHQFAKRLDLRHSWFQDATVKHYDLTPNKRLQALHAGAVESNLRDWMRLRRQGV